MADRTSVSGSMSTLLKRDGNNKDVTLYYQVEYDAPHNSFTFPPFFLQFLNLFHLRFLEARPIC